MACARRVRQSITTSASPPSTPWIAATKLPSGEMAAARIEAACVKSAAVKCCATAGWAVHNAKAKTAKNQRIIASPKSRDTFCPWEARLARRVKPSPHLAAGSGCSWLRTRGDRELQFGSRATAQHIKFHSPANAFAREQFVDRIHRRRQFPIKPEDHVAFIETRRLARPAGGHRHNQHAALR